MSRPTEVVGDQLRAIVERIEHIDASRNSTKARRKSISKPKGMG